jgi:hypothetical protein
VARALVSFVFLIAWSASVSAQSDQPNPHDAQPQRPTVATHAGTVAPGWLEIEAGTEFDRYSDRSHGGAVPIVAKLGLAPRFQLEVQTPLVRAPGPHGVAVGDLLLGVKWRMVEHKRIVADLAVFPSLKLPTGSTDSDAGTGTTDLGALLISSRSLGPVSLDLNVAYTHRVGDDTFAPHNAGLWAAAFGGPAGGQFGWVAELFGFPPTSGPAGDRAVVAALCGPTMKIHAWLVVDTGVIVPISGPQPRAIYAGVVYNIGQVWR